MEENVGKERSPKSDNNGVASPPDITVRFRRAAMDNPLEQLGAGMDGLED